MKQLLGLALASGLCFGIAGCNNLTTIETDVQSAAVTACAFEPTLASIAAILTATTGGATTEAQVATIAANICTAVTNAPQTTAGGETFSARKVVYPGTNVVIQGVFVKK